MLLAHGTKVSALASIAQHGLKPRGTKGTNNWKHTVGSNPATVYLTTAYALYFSWCASDPAVHEASALLEVQAATLAPLLVADEDAVEQVMRLRPDQEPERIRNWDMKRRTLYYRNRADRYSWEGSVEALGTCGYRGTIPAQCIGRVVLVEYDTMMELILRYGLDPSISVQAFVYMGKRYEHSQRWLFGDECDLRSFTGEVTCGPALSLPGVKQFDSLDAAIAHLQGQQLAKERA